MRTYRITHRTAYSYESDVSASYGRMRLLPRDLPWQRCVQSNVWLDPAPADHSEHVDLFGNRVDYFSIHEPHRELVITAESVVEVDYPAGLPLAGSLPWESSSRGQNGPNVTEIATIERSASRIQLWLGGLMLR